MNFSRRRFYFAALVVLLMSATAFAASSIYDFTMNSIDGKPTPLADYKGKVVLIVNVASRCGFTPQYTALESIYEKYKDQGFVITGFPANNFGSQEPGTNSEIKTFCQSKYSVTFPMFSESFGEGRRHDAALPVPDDDRESRARRRHQVELHEVPRGPQRKSGEAL